MSVVFARRREVLEPSEPHVLGDLTIDFTEREVTLAGQPAHLLPMEYWPLAEISVSAGGC